MPLGAFQRPSASLRTDSVAGPASDRHAGDDQSWPIPVGEPTGRYLHERIGPKKRAENYVGGVGDINDIIRGIDAAASLKHGLNRTERRHRP